MTYTMRMKRVSSMGEQPLQISRYQANVVGCAQIEDLPMSKAMVSSGQKLEFPLCLLAMLQGPTLGHPSSLAKPQDRNPSMDAAGSRMASIVDQTARLG